MRKNSNFLTLFVCCSVIFTDMLGSGIITPSIPIFMKMLKATETQMGFAFAAYSIAFMLVVLPTGKLVDKFNKNNLIIAAGMFSLFLASLFLITTQSILAFSTARALQGIASAVSWVAAQPLAARCGNESDKNVASALSYISASYGMGLIAGPIVGSLNPLHLPFFIMALLSMSMTLLSLFFIKDIEPSVNKKIHKSKNNERGIFYGCLIIFYAYLNVGVMELLFPIYMDSLLFQKIHIGVLFSIIAITLTISQPLILRWTKTSGMIIPLMISVLSSGVILLLLPQFETFLWWVLFSIIFGASLGAMVTLSMTLIANSTAENEQGFSYALWNMSFSLSFLISPSISGVLATSLGIKIPFYLMGILSLPVIFLIKRDEKFIEMGRN